MCVCVCVLILHVLVCKCGQKTNGFHVGPHITFAVAPGDAVTNQWSPLVTLTLWPVWRKRETERHGNTAPYIITHFSVTPAILQDAFPTIGL